MRGLKSCAILPKDVVSFGNGHQYSLCDAKTDGKQSALCFSAEKPLLFHLYHCALARGELVELSTARPSLHVINRILSDLQSRITRSHQSFQLSVFCV